jgi:hypothetical protein
MVHAKHVNHMLYIYTDMIPKTDRKWDGFYASRAWDYDSRIPKARVGIATWSWGVSVVVFGCVSRLQYVGVFV